MKIGVDIEDISRFKDKSLEKCSNFLNRIYTKSELDYCFKDKNFAAHLAVRFCAKEAVYKALNQLTDKNISLKDIEILNNDKGVPYINLKNIESEYKIEISLSHDRTKAIAYAIIQEV